MEIMVSMVMFVKLNRHLSMKLNNDFHCVLLTLFATFFVCFYELHCSFMSTSVSCVLFIMLKYKQ